jgi:hypothetical protein
VTIFDVRGRLFETTDQRLKAAHERGTEDADEESQHKRLAMPADSCIVLSVKSV